MKDDVRDARRRGGQATRERIEAEALRLFAGKGFDGTSVKDIAAAVGVADAALYRHFRSKDEIAATLFRTHYAALAAEIDRIGASDVAFGQIVEELVFLFCRLFDEHPDVFRFILMNQHAQLDGISDDENAVERLRMIMERAARREDIASSDADLAAAIALGAVVHPATFKLYGRIGRSLSAHAVEIAAAVKRALGCKSAG